MWEKIKNNMITHNMKYEEHWFGDFFDCFKVTVPYEGEIEWCEDYPGDAWIYLDVFEKLDLDCADDDFNLPYGYEQFQGVRVNLDDAVNMFFKLGEWAKQHYDELSELL